MMSGRYLAWHYVNGRTSLAYRCCSGWKPILEPEIGTSKRASLSVPFVQLLEHLQASTEPPLPRSYGRAAI